MGRLEQACSSTRSWQAMDLAGNGQLQRAPAHTVPPHQHSSIPCPLTPLQTSLRSAWGCAVVGSALFISEALYAGTIQMFDISSGRPAPLGPFPGQLNWGFFMAAAADQTLFVSEQATLSVKQLRLLDAELLTSFKSATQPSMYFLGVLPVSVTTPADTVYVTQGIVSSPPRIYSPIDVYVRTM